MTEIGKPGSHGVDLRRIADAMEKQANALDSLANNLERLIEKDLRCDSSRRDFLRVGVR